jgi:hypothetical protein
MFRWIYFTAEAGGAGCTAPDVPCATRPTQLLPTTCECVLYFCVVVWCVVCVVCMVRVVCVGARGVGGGERTAGCDGALVLEDVGGTEDLEVVGLVVVGQVEQREHVVVVDVVAEELLHHRSQPLPAHTNQLRIRKGHSTHTRHTRHTRHT